MPFGPAIPVAGLFGSAAHKEAVARLRWLISARGLGVLTGEVGSGKTAAVRAAASGLDASRNTLIYLPNPQIGVRGIHGAVAVALGQAPRFHHATLIPQVEAALAAEADERNHHVLLAIDESHLLTGEQLDAVRMLTNSDLDSRSPLTILLIGQPTLRRRLRVGDMAALDQRVQLRYHIPAPAPRPAACPAPSTGSPSPPCSRPTPPARPSSTSPPPAPPSARKPPTRQADHHAATVSTTTPPGTCPAGFLTPRRPHPERRLHGHPERRRTPGGPPVGRAGRESRACGSSLRRWWSGGGAQPGVGAGGAGRRGCDGGAAAVGGAGGAADEA